MPLFGNNAGAGRAGLFHRCCLATCKLATTWQNEWQLCTINTAICSLTKKTKRGVYGLTKQTYKKPLCNCLLIINGKRRRPELHINPAKLEAHTATLLGTCTACSTVLSSGLPCTLLWSIRTSSRSEERVMCKAQAALAMNERGTGARWSAEKRFHVKLKLHTINVPKHRNSGQLPCWCLCSAVPGNTCKMAAWDHIPLLPTVREKRLFLHSRWPLWQK